MWLIVVIFTITYPPHYKANWKIATTRLCRYILNVKTSFRGAISFKSSSNNKLLKCKIKPNEDETFGKMNFYTISNNQDTSWSAFFTKNL